MLLNQSWAQDQSHRERPYPVVLGAGLSGLAISRALSAQGIDHVLVGKKPSDTPRLGESLNPDGSLEIVRQFPDQSQFFFTKRRVALFFDGTTADLDTLQYAAGRAMFSALDYPSTVPLVHVDRIGFDATLFDAALRDQHCLFAESHVTDIAYNPNTDRIDGIYLANGAAIAASYVFDATNHLRVAARRIGVPYQPIGDPRRVVFAHHRRGDPAAGTNFTAEPPQWTKATSLVRLDQQTDAADGIAWCIPLGDYVSLGISVDPAVTGANPALMMGWVEQAYARRGIDVVGSFAQRGTPVDQQYEHYTHKRCHGRNWLLVGPTCCQIWFPAAAGVATGLIAARLAPDILRAPAHVAPLYQDYIDRVAASHPALAWLDEPEPHADASTIVGRNTQAMIRGTTKRLIRYLQLQNVPDELAFGDALARLYEGDRLLANPSRIDTAPPNAQATRLFAARDDDPWSSGPADISILPSAKVDGPAAILGIIDMLSGGRDPATSVQLVADDMTLCIDQFSLKGLAGWIAWVTALRLSPEASTLQLNPASLAQQQDDWILTGQWQAQKGGRAAVSPPVSMIFTLAGDRIAKIRTARADYTFVLGDTILPAAAFAVFLGRLLPAGPSGTTASAA